MIFSGKNKTKILTCSSDEINKVASLAMEEWIVAVLKAVKIDAGIIEKVLNDSSYSKESWRRELFYKNGIEVLKYRDKINILKHHANKDHLVLGEWNNPEIVHVKKDKIRSCELHLNYWQVVSI